MTPREGIRTRIRNQKYKLFDLKEKGGSAKATHQKELKIKRLEQELKDYDEANNTGENTRRETEIN